MQSAPITYRCHRHLEVDDATPCHLCQRPFCANCLVTIQGQRLCAECKHARLCRSFRHDPRADYSVTVEYVEPLPDVGLPAKATCAVHPVNAAVTACQRCGDFTCALCHTNFEGKRYCSACLNLLWERGSLAPPKPAPLASASLLVSVISVAMYCTGPLAMIGSLVGLVLGVAALGQIHRDSQLAGKGYAITGIVFGSLGLLLGAGITVLWFGVQ